jgi:Flp pilus assembly protein TadD
LATKIDHGWAPLYALRAERFLYVRAPRPELYDSEADPAQVRNLLEGNPQAVGESVVSSMESSLEQILAAEVEDRPSTTDEETLERLRALGYALPAGQVDPTGTDPKDGVLWSVEFDAATDRYETGDPVARQTLIDLEEKLPSSGNLRRILVEIAIRDGDLEAALAHAEKAAKLIPMSAYDLMMLGFVRENLGDLEGSIAAYREAAIHDPEYDRIQLGLMTGAIMEGRAEEALEHERHLRRLLEQGERRVQLWQIGERWQMVGQDERAGAIYREALSEGAESGRLRMLYAIVLVKLGQAAAAPEQLEKAGASARTPDLADLLGVAYASQGDLETAERIFRRVLGENPGYGPSREHLTRVLQMQGRTAEAEQ